LKLKFQTVAEKTAKNFRRLVYFAAPGIQEYRSAQISDITEVKMSKSLFKF